MNENEKLFFSYKNKICSGRTKNDKMEEAADIPTSKYLADYLYVVREDVPFLYYRKVSEFMLILSQILTY